MDAKWQAASTPSEGHDALNPLVGRWNTTTKLWFGPNTAPETTTGSSSSIWILGGRFVQEDYKGKMSGKPFTGRGMIAFDNVQQKYLSTWSDSMSTTILLQEGDFDKAKNALSFRGQYIDPVSGREVKTRSVTTIASKDRHVIEMFETLPSGEEVKSLEVTYTRAK